MFHFNLIFYFIWKQFMKKKIIGKLFIVKMFETLVDLMRERQFELHGTFVTQNTRPSLLYMSTKEKEQNDLKEWNKRAKIDIKKEREKYIRSKFLLYSFARTCVCVCVWCLPRVFYSLLETKLTGIHDPQIFFFFFFKISHSSCHASLWHNSLNAVGGSCFEVLISIERGIYNTMSAFIVYSFSLYINTVVKKKINIVINCQ